MRCLNTLCAAAVLPHVLETAWPQTCCSPASSELRRCSYRCIFSIASVADNILLLHKAESISARRLRASTQGLKLTREAHEWARAATALLLGAKLLEKPYVEATSASSATQRIMVLLRQVLKAHTGTRGGN